MLLDPRQTGIQRSAGFVVVWFVHDAVPEMDRFSISAWMSEN
jgi:hypothetical protein